MPLRPDFPAGAIPPPAPASGEGPSSELPPLSSPYARTSPRPANAPAHRVLRQSQPVGGTFLSAKSILLLALAFLVGTLPLGHWLLGRRGQDSRLSNAYNLGVENMVRRVGLGAAVGSAALDAAKGFMAVLMASALGSPELCVLGADNYDDFYVTQGHSMKDSWTTAEAIAATKGKRRIWVFNNYTYNITRLTLPYPLLEERQEGKIKLSLYAVTDVP